MLSPSEKRNVKILGIIKAIEVEQFANTPRIGELFTMFQKGSQSDVSVIRTKILGAAKVILCGNDKINELLLELVETIGFEKDGVTSA